MTHPAAVSQTEIYRAPLHNSVHGSVGARELTSALDKGVSAAFFGAMYYCMGQAGLSLAGYAGEIALICPSMGVGVAGLWILGPVVLPFLFLAELVTLLVHNGMGMACTLAIGNIAGIWLGVRFYRRARTDVPYFLEPRNTVLFMVLTALVPGFISASVGVVALRMSGAIPPLEASKIWCLWWLGDMTGAIVVASCLLVWFKEGIRDCLRFTGPSLMIAGVLLISAWTVFRTSGSAVPEERPLSFVLVPLFAWAAYTMSHRELVTTVLLGSCYAVWATLSGNGPFVTAGYPDSLLLLQIYILVLTSTAFIVHATASSHRNAVASLQRTQDAAIFSLASLAETRDPETGGHILRTRAYVRVLAEQLHDHVRFAEYLTPKCIELLYKSAPLHDIGKVGVPDAILCKPGRVTPEEFVQIQRHPLCGRDALVNATVMLGQNSFLKLAEEIILTHHERWDGAGYPQGLRGEDIPISGRLMALADVYDALISERCYKAAMPHEQAREIILEGRGTHFDPAVVDAFLRRERDFMKIAAQYSDAAVAVC